MISRACILSLLGVIMCALLDGLGFKSKKLFATLCALLLFTALGEGILGITDSLSALCEQTGISDALTSALKVIGLGYTFGFTAEICQSLGENTIASAVTAVGRVEILVCVFPYFEKLVTLGVELLK